MLVLLVRLGFKAQKRWQLMLMMRTVCFSDRKTDACIACADAHDAPGLV